MMPDKTNEAMINTGRTQLDRALTYSEMMNEGRQRMTASNSEQDNGLEKRLDELERKVEHLQKVVQRQLRLGREAK
tara:strand:+ start:796 stop:1023 length:228 start_codon:yes stop_codon:yes gene_type:complete